MAEEPLTNQPLDIPKDDRISNVANLPSDFDPNDPTQVNADWIMNMFDKLVNGNYNVRPFAVYNSVANLPTTFLNKDNEECAMPKGACAYVLEEGYENTFFIFNGTTWAKVSGGGKCALQVTCSYNNDVLKGVAVVIGQTTINTKSNGLSTFTGLDSGTKNISVSKDGYKTTTASTIVENTFETIDIEMQPISVLFTIKDGENQAIAGATINFNDETKLTDNNGQASFQQVPNGTYIFSIIAEGYETITGTIFIDSADFEQPVTLHLMPVECYAVDNIEINDAVKVNAGVGDSETDYNVYAANTAITNILTLDGLARSTTSAGEIASVRITTKDAQITVEANEDDCDIKFNNDNEINEVNINVVAKDLYLAFIQSDKIIYFKNNTLPFIPIENVTFENKSYTYYTYDNNSMIEHTATTSSVTVGANTYDGTILNINTSDNFSNGIWTRNVIQDIQLDDNTAVITTNGYLTTPNPIIPTDTYFKFLPAKLNSEQWDTTLIIGGQEKKFINYQEFTVKANQLIEIYYKKHNSSELIDTTGKYFYISNDKMYKKLNYITTTNVATSTIKFNINGVEFSTIGSTANIDLYEGDTVNWEVSAEGYTTQSGSYTVASYPTISSYINEVVLVQA